MHFMSGLIFMGHLFANMVLVINRMPPYKVAASVDSRVWNTAVQSQMTHTPIQVKKCNP